MTPPGAPPYTPVGAAERLQTSITPTRSSAHDDTLERGFVASLRWLVSEGDARGVRRIAVELRALREALATLDETRAARDDQSKRAQELDREIQAAIAVLGPATAVHGNGSLVQRLAKLRERIHEDAESRRQLIAERDAFKAMCQMMVLTRARVHEMLEESERERDRLTELVTLMRERVITLHSAKEDAGAESEHLREQLADMRDRLKRWTGTVERALKELAKVADEG